MASPGPRTPARRRNPGQARQAAHRRGVDGHLADHDRAPHRRAEHPGQHLRAEGPPLDHTRLGQHRLYRLQPEHLDAFYTWLAAQGLKPNTIVQIHRILSAPSRSRGNAARPRATSPPWSTPRPPRKSTSSRSPAPKPAASWPPPASAITACAGRSRSRSAFRQSEAIGLRWKYVDLDAGTIEVGWQLKRHRFKHGCPDTAACTADRHRRPCPPKCETHKHRMAARPTAANEATVARR